MEAIKTLQRVKNHQVLIPMPGDYENAEVEVIVLLYPHHRMKKNRKEEFLTILRNGPTLSEQEIAEIETVSKESQQWTIPEF